MDALDRTLQPTRRVLGDVDPAQPLDTTHPLLDGVQGLWVPVPHLTGGSKFYDLSGRGNHGVLDGSGFYNDDRVLAPALDVSSSDDIKTGLSFSGGRTIAAYLTVPEHTDTHRIGVSNFYVGEDNNNGFLFGYTDGFIYSNTANVVDTPVSIVGTLLPSGASKIYINGQLANTGSGSATNVTGLELGQRGSRNEFGGNLFACLVSTSAWSEGMVKAWESNLRRGFPDLLRRRSDVGLLGGGGGTTVSLAATELQHTHTLELSSVSAIYSLSADELQQAHALGSPSVSVGYSLTTSELQQAQTLESPSLAIAGLLTPEDVRHGHTVESTLTDVRFALTTDALQQTHTLGAGGVDVAYALTPQGLQHLHSLGPSTLQAIFGLTPEDLSQAHTIESPSGSGLVILSVDGMTHPHRLGQVTLGTVGFATKIDVSASPIYDTDSTARELYQITLNATPILE